ncbi:hypothetical protein [Bradyrhizobium australafricanum]|uniref:hypothetical protein n=1 Tax=Bradyrhizobium australafricanum TaxID=2821406 RepID=UPI001CE2D056|nr:hypothetical protein [Bradyrhizobium australafricanum]MCA6105198.1 hypothetical protein [Bradyrhizobium australafricanum]
MSDQERELHDVNGCLERFFTLRSEFAQCLGDAQDGTAREALENVLGHIEALEREYRARRDERREQQATRPWLARRPASANRCLQSENTIRRMGAMAVREELCRRQDRKSSSVR